MSEDVKPRLKGPGYREYECKGTLYRVAKEGLIYRISIPADESNVDKDFGFVDTADTIPAARAIIRQHAKEHENSTK